MIGIRPTVDSPGDSGQEGGQAGGGERHMGPMTSRHDLDRLLQRGPTQDDHEGEADLLDPAEQVHILVARGVVGREPIPAPRRVPAEEDPSHSLLHLGILITPNDQVASSGIA
jgi:hypothetical protein